MKGLPSPGTTALGIKCQHMNLEVGINIQALEQGTQNFL